MLVQAREAWPTAEPSLVFLPPRRRGLLTRLPRPVRVACVALGGVISLVGAACAPTPAPPPINPERTKMPSTQIARQTTLENFLPFKGPSRLTGGPHDSFRKGGIRDGFDVAPNIAPDILGLCSPGVKKVLDEPLVVASASGVVTKVGNERNRTDPYHSIVAIQKADGSIVGAEHLDQIQVSVDDKVIGGETVIGKVSCEVPAGGYTQAPHVHVSSRDKDGNQIPIAGQTFSGYTIHADAKEYYGTMVRQDGVVITAISGQRCGPDESSIKACDGKRNDLNTGVVLGESVKLAPPPAVAAVAPAKPVPKEVKPPPDFDTHRSTVAPYLIDYPGAWRIVISSKPKDNFTLEHFFPGGSADYEVRVRSEEIKRWVTPEDYRDNLINQTKASVALAPGLTGPDMTPRSVAGKKGWMLNYHFTYDRHSMIVVFAATEKELGWQISLIGRSHLTDQAISTFNQMIDSMKLR